MIAAHTQAATVPSIAGAVPAPGTIGVLTQITVTFSEPVADVSPSDLVVGGFPAATVTGGGASYTFTLERQPAYGSVTVTWDPGHAIVDLENPPVRFDETAPSASWQYQLVDGTAPTLSAVAPAAGISVRQLGQIEVTFSEGVLGVDAADLLINGAPASSVSATGAGRYLFTFPPPPAGVVQVAWAAGHGIRDFASPANHFAGGAWSYTLDPNLGLAKLRINEFTTSNVNTNRLKDEDGELSDWIEIHNFGDTPVNLAGYSLTDDEADPGKWTFPATNLAAGQFVIVFASEKDRKTLTSATNRLHTNFKLGLFGNYLGLFNAESPRTVIHEFAPEYPEQRNDYSYGYDAGGALKYFANPTPGAANGASAIAFPAPPVHFNVERGLYDSPFNLILSSTLDGATIRYTSDGSEPTDSTGSVYAGPLTISNTVAIRAAAFKAGALPSLPVTHTYLFIDQVVQQPNRPAGFPVDWGANSGFPGGRVPADYEMDMDPLRVDPNNTNSPVDAVKLQRLKDGLREMPTLSIVMKTDDIFGTAGIYQRSAVETGTPGTKPENKKPCSVELILPDGKTAFATTCGIDLHGNASRNPVKNPKHGFKLKFKSEYGPASLKYRLFEDSAVEEFDDILLRADFNSSWRHWSDTAGQGLGAFQRTRAVRTRDAWMKESMRDMGGLASHSRFCHVYLNGLYWGTYDLSEDPSATFAKTALGGSEEDFDVVDQAYSKNGDLVAYNAMTALPAAGTLAQYEAYHQYLNMPEFIDYMMLHFFMGHQDWSTTVTKNWAAVRKRVPGAEGTFRYLPWDGECILLNEDVNRVTVTTPPSGLHTKLDDSLEYRLLFADRVHRSMVAPGGALTPAENLSRWKKWQAVMDKPIVAEAARWGDYRRDVHQSSEGVYQLYTRENHFLAEHARMLGYFSNRNATVLDQLRAVNIYPQVSAPVFNQQGGYVARGFGLTMASSNTIYFTLDATDPRVYGTGAVAPAAQTYGGAIALSNAVVVKARARFGTNWSALNETTFTVDALGSPLRITEIMYNPIGGDAYEFVELRNVGPLAVNVGQYIIEGIDYAFPPGTILLPGQIVVLGSSTAPANWTARYPGVTVFGRFDASLGNGGEKLVIRDAAGRSVWSVDYDDENGWPTAADGQGASIEIIDVFGDPDAPANWRASLAANGTPGTLSGPPAGSTTMVLNEVMAANGVVPHSSGAFYDWIELRNISAQPVNLAGWSLSDSSNPRRYVFPATNVPPGGYVFVWMAPFVGELNDLVSGFGLSRSGQSIFLYDAGTNLIDRVSFGLQLTNHSIGRVGADWQLTHPTPRLANVAAATASTSNLSINEWLANPFPGTDDWLELHNRSAASPVSLAGIYLAVSDALSQVGPLSFIPAGGFVQFNADGNPGGNNLDFTLASAGGTIVLYSETGAELDRVTYGPQAEGVSQGRLPDGAANVVHFPATPSPEASNYLLANWTGPILNEVLAINRSAATNASGHTADFVELRNTNATSFDLGGARLSTSPENASQWTFPAGTVIPANGYLVVWFDDERPATTNASAVLNTGRSLEGDSDEVVLFSATGQPVDSIAYGLQIADQPLGRRGASWTLLQSATPGGANAPAAALGVHTALRINEWLSAPVNGSDWFEIYNGGANAVALGGLYLSDSLASPSLTQFEIPALSFIAGHGFARFVADGDPDAGRHHVNFNLDGQGEALRIFSAESGVIDAVSFGGQPANVSSGCLPDGSGEIVDFSEGGTPGGSNFRPHPAVVISEVLSHSDAPLEDAIEIYNRSAVGVDLSGWFLSDSAENFRKFRLPAGTFLPAGGYRAFHQVQFDDGSANGFSLDSARGDRVILSEADAVGNFTGYRAQVEFGAALNGVSFGRVEMCHGVDFVPQVCRTFGEDNPATLAQFRTSAGLFNAGPRIGPVVINELMYHPPGVGTNDNVLDEYIELHNAGASSVALFDAANPSNTWRLRGGVAFNLPPGVTLAGGGYALVVNFDPLTNPAQLAAFRSLHGLPVSLPIYGPYSGRLDNGGERIELLQPDTPQATDGFVPYVLVDAVTYGDAAPWPYAGGGDGASLQRAVALEFGNDAGNWTAAGPTAGRANPVQPGVAPAIVVGPLSRAVSLGSRVIFSVSVCGSAPFTYQWKRAGADIGGATNASLVLASAQGGDSGSYSVLVSNGAGSVLSDAALLSFMDPPVITSQPQGLETGAGNDVSFSVTATGSGPLSYQWRRSAVVLPGATNAVLLLANVHRADAGDYSVLVMNAAGGVASSAAALSVLVPPTITLQPEDLVVSPGTNVSFRVAATGVGFIRYQWQFNGVDIPEATNATFSLSNVQLPQEGDYRVIVADDIASGPSRVARLTVKVFPRILVPPVGLTNAVGSSFTLSVTASGSVPMGFEWRRGAIKLTNIVLMTTNCSFTIYDAQTIDSGVYRVIITNSAISALLTNATATVLIQAPPVITNAPVDLTVEPGATATFFSGASGSALFYQWQRDGVNIAGATSATLTLTNASEASEGTYRVVVTNFVGMASASANLSVGSPAFVLRDLVRLPNGSVQMLVVGATNRVYAIEASSNLTNWVTLGTVTFTNGQLPFTDGSASVTNRFYRARMLP